MDGKTREGIRQISNHDARNIDWYRRLVAEDIAEDGQRIAVETYDKLEMALNEIDRLTAKVTALERAINYARSCRTCTHHLARGEKDDFSRLFEEPCASCNAVVRQHFQFAEARFAGGDEG